MAQNIELLGAQYLNVPGVLLPKTGGGSALFTDVTGTTATQDSVENGKVFFDSNGNKKTGTAIIGLEYEYDSWNQTSDSNRHIIYFSNEHADLPMFLCIVDSTGTNNTTSYTAYALTFSNYLALSNAVPSNVSSPRRLGFVAVTYRGTGSPGEITQGITGLNGSSAGAMSYWVSTTQFNAYTLSDSRYWRSGRKYTWIAVWP